MNSAIDTFVKTGKFSFKDFARSVIQDIIAIQLKAAATKIFSSVVGSLFGLADGGPATAGKPYVVGEEGPEIFVPKASGTVIPNGQAMGGAGTGASAGGGGQTVNNYVTNNISAVDAKSVAQLFAENRKVLLGSVQLAQKEAPYTNR
jgi:phage-related minor tail protein